MWLKAILPIVRSITDWIEAGLVIEKNQIIPDSNEYVKASCTLNLMWGEYNKNGICTQYFNISSFTHGVQGNLSTVATGLDKTRCEN
jgi:hypothetical protein